MSHEIVNLDNVTVTYGSRIALNSMSLSFGEGLHIVLGPNGAGKSTMMKAIATLISPTSGTIRVGDAIISPEKRRSDRGKIRSHIGFLGQDNLPRTRMKVADFLAHISWLKCIPKEDISETVYQAAERANLIERLDDGIHTLSGGMRRRVGIAAALVGNPLVLLLDEPAADLDPEHRQRMRQLLVDIARTTAVICSTHDLNDLLSEAESITVIRQGEKRFHGSVAEFDGPAGASEHYREERYLELLG